MKYLFCGYYDKLTIGFALVIALGCGVSNAAAQTDKYPRMAAIGEYLMEKNAEIQLARSAAPDSISRDATILVLGRQGYETAVEGKTVVRRHSEGVGNPPALRAIKSGTPVN